MKMRSSAFLSAAMFLLMLMLGAATPALAGKTGANKDCAAKESATAFCGKCGDGYCAKQCGETAESCPADCGVIESRLMACSKCGDGRCTPQCGENAQTCPKDCGVESARGLSLLSK